MTVTAGTRPGAANEMTAMTTATSGACATDRDVAMRVSMKCRQRSNEHDLDAMQLRD